MSRGNQSSVLSGFEEHLDPVEVAGAQSGADVGQGRSDVSAVKAATGSFKFCIIGTLIGSLNQFGGNRVSLLWHGRRSNFTADEFEGNCNDHMNPLTLILDPNGGVFNGFTRVE
jgi:hypothetical protein